MSKTRRIHRKAITRSFNHHQRFRQPSDRRHISPWKPTVPIISIQSLTCRPTISAVTWIVGKSIEIRWDRTWWTRFIHCRLTFVYYVEISTKMCRIAVSSSAIKRWNSCRKLCPSWRLTTHFQKSHKWLRTIWSIMASMDRIKSNAPSRRTAMSVTIWAMMSRSHNSHQRQSSRRQKRNKMRQNRGQNATPEERDASVRAAVFSAHFIVRCRVNRWRVSWLPSGGKKLLRHSRRRLITVHRVSI